jgi:hypothetical protein
LLSVLYLQVIFAILASLKRYEFRKFTLHVYGVCMLSNYKKKIR